MSAPALALFTGQGPRLHHDTFIDWRPDRPGAEAMRRGYVRLLKRHGLAERYGVYVRQLQNRQKGWGIYVGPQGKPLQVRTGRVKVYSSRRQERQ